MKTNTNRKTQNKETGSKTRTSPEMQHHARPPLTSPSTTRLHGKKAKREFKNFLLAGSLLGVNGSLLTHGGKDGDVGVLLLDLVELVDLVTNIAIGDLDIILGVTVIAHQREVAIVRDVQKLVLAASNVGDVHVVGGRAQLLKLLGGEDVNGDQVDLGVTVLASLGGRHVDDLAGTALDDDEAVLAESRALDGVGGRSTGISRVEGNLVLDELVLIIYINGGIRRGPLKR